MGLGVGENSCEFVTEGIGFAANKEAILNSCQKLVLQDVDILLGFLGHVEIEQISRFCEQNNKIFLYSDLGAVIPCHLR
jgi:branched-chain amino acid transport system substrate-binding protein